MWRETQQRRRLVRRNGGRCALDCGSACWGSRAHAAEEQGLRSLEGCKQEGGRKRRRESFLQPATRDITVFFCSEGFRASEWQLCVCLCAGACTQVNLNMFAPQRLPLTLPPSSLRLSVPFFSFSRFSSLSLHIPRSILSAEGWPRPPFLLFFGAPMPLGPCPHMLRLSVSDRLRTLEEWLYCQ